MRLFEDWLKCVSGGVPCDEAVYYYVMGDRFAARCGQLLADRGQVAAAGQAATTIHFQPDGGLQAAPRPAMDASSSYGFDPAQPVPTVAAGRT